jgi:hypothetical protein
VTRDRTLSTPYKRDGKSLSGCGCNIGVQAPFQALVSISEIVVEKRYIVIKRTLKCDNGVYPARSLLATCIPHNVPAFARDSAREPIGTDRVDYKALSTSSDGELHIALQPWSYDSSSTSEQTIHWLLPENLSWRSKRF